jgi:hypothetical protein
MCAHCRSIAEGGGHHQLKRLFWLDRTGNKDGSVDLFWVDNNIERFYKFDFFLDEACLLINCSFHTVLLKGISILEHSVLQRKFSVVAIYLFIW